MSSLLFDDFLYRWFHYDGEWYYGSSFGKGYHPFSAMERSQLLSRLITSLLTHDHLYVRIEQLEEFIDLVGINETLLLLQEKVLIVIDDGGTFTGFLPQGENNLLMNFSAATTFQFDNVLKRLDEQYVGKMGHRLLKSLIYRADETKAKVDGAWLQHLTGEEAQSDLKNQRLTKLLQFEQAYDNIIVKENDMLPLLRLNQANKSLIYQNELKITTLSTESDTQRIIANKYGSYFGQNQSDPVLLFNDILKDKQIPDLSVLYQKGIVSMKNILALRNSFDGRTFREWLESNDYNRASIYKTLLSNSIGLTPFAWQSMVRWAVPTIVGIFHTWAGVALSSVDNFIVNKLMNDWHPNLFLDHQLAKKLNDLRGENEKAETLKKQISIFGRKIGRNDPCHCGSGKKHKNCCGK